VKMSMWPRPPLVRTPILSESPSWHSRESLSSHLAPPTLSWETISASVTDGDGSEAKKSNRFPGSFPRRRIRNWRSWKSRRYLNTTQRSRGMIHHRTDHNLSSGSISVHSRSEVPVRENDDGFETESSESGYPVEEAHGHSDEDASTRKRRNFTVQDVTDSSLEIIHTQSGGVVPVGNRPEIGVLLSQINTTSQEHNGSDIQQLDSGNVGVRVIEENTERIYSNDAAVQDHATHAEELQQGMQETIIGTTSTLDWHRNLQPSGNNSANLELVPTNNFWWERYRSFLESASLNAGSETPGGEQVEVSEVRQAQEYMVDPASYLIALASSPFDTPDLSPGQCFESLGNLEPSESPSLKASTSGFSDSESITPILRLRGGGLSEKGLKTKFTYVEDLDETDGTAIRGSRRSASVKSVKGKRVATQGDLETSRSSSPSNSINLYNNFFI
jgi:hypothetical protein